MTILQAVAMGTPPTVAFAIAIWRFARLETVVRHQGKCQKVTVKALVRLRRDLNKHIERGEK